MRNGTKEQTKGRKLAKTVNFDQDPYAVTEHQDEHYKKGETSLRLSHRRATVRTSHQDNTLRESKNCRLCRKTERDFCGSKTRTNRQNKSSSQKHKPTDSDTATNRQNKSSGEAATTAINWKKMPNFRSCHRIGLIQGPQGSLDFTLKLDSFRPGP